MGSRFWRAESAPARLKHPVMVSFTWSEAGRRLGGEATDMVQHVQCRHSKSSGPKIMSVLKQFSYQNKSVQRIQSRSKNQIDTVTGQFPEIQSVKTRETESYLQSWEPNVQVRQKDTRKKSQVKTVKDWKVSYGRQSQTAAYIDRWNQSAWLAKD